MTDEELAWHLIQEQQEAIAALEGLLSTRKNILATLEGLADQRLPLTSAVEILSVHAQLHADESARAQAYRAVAKRLIDAKRKAQKESNE